MLTLYKYLMFVLYPLWCLWLRVRAWQGKEETARLSERYGYATVPRPEGKLVWIHAASVGEVTSVLPLINALQKQHPQWVLLVTTGTVTSAAHLQTRLKQPVLHQYLPIDTSFCAARFLVYWQPSLVLWVESELWPMTLQAMQQRGVPCLLINARLSSRSFQRWQRLPHLAKMVVGAFTAVYAQTATYAKRLQHLGAKNVQVGGNLKADAEALPFDERTLAVMKAAIGNRPVWLAASIHSPEDKAIIEAAQALRVKWPDILTILVPRHPQRGLAMAQDLGKLAAHVCRSQGAIPSRDEPYYIADTLGELGLWYALSPIVFIGGSLFPHGGQNILEPSLFHCALLHGSHMHNFPDMMVAFSKHNASITVQDAQELAQQVAFLLADASKVDAYAAAASAAAQELQGAKATIMQAMQPYLKGGA